MRSLCSYSVSLKVIVVGNGMVGKTSLITRFATGRMTDGYKKTIGTDFMEKELRLRQSDEVVRLMLWDTAGQEMFSRLTRSYYKGSGAVVFVFSTTDRESFLELPRWQEKVRSEVGDIVAVLVQNKVDLLHEAQVSADEAEAMARRLGLRLYRACVKDNVLVEDVFQDIAARYVDDTANSAAGHSDGVASIHELTVREDVQQQPPHSAELGRTEGREGAGERGEAAVYPADPRDERGAGVESDGGAGGASGAGSNSSEGASGADSAESDGGKRRRRRPRRGDERVAGAFQLTPLTVRTGGKKRNALVQQLCTIL